MVLQRSDLIVVQLSSRRGCMIARDGSAIVRSVSSPETSPFASVIMANTVLAISI